VHAFGERRFLFLDRDAGEDGVGEREPERDREQPEKLGGARGFVDDKPLAAEDASTPRRR
jgi:hypothetical protein